jgi:hypothetical protein
LVGKLERKRTLGRPKGRAEYIKIKAKEQGWTLLGLIWLREVDVGGFCERGGEFSYSIKWGEF